ncbi:MAG: SHOCT domain-containing protein [Saprospiraceae bacterium]|uniref:SHOCT domain-containing protein n=1 Tax=Candidatus Opimibacter skivensis TaxID=2982028 RepID=A0A9D7SVX0_9BACT|nr:SHOCT domain-containing protein [Candidatus Opimibacter skivensis]
MSQLKRLGELRDRGLLSEQEFMIEKKKLTR